jgi:hypothetical protein
MDSSPQTAGQDPFLTGSMQNSSSQYDSPSSSFNPTIQQSANEFAQDPQLFSAAQDHSQVESVQPLQTPQRQRMPQSQYYIVFSVTGIERSNAKNPIIRFDAKVLPLGPMLFPFSLTNLLDDRPIFHGFVRRLCVISEELIMSL